MKYTGNDQLRAQTIRLGNQIAVLFKKKEPLILRKKRLEQKRKDAIHKGMRLRSIHIGEKMTTIDRRLKEIDEKIHHLERACYQNYRHLTGN